MEVKSETSVLFIGKADDPFSAVAADFISRKFKDPLIIFSRRSDPFPAHLYNWQGELIISYLAQWIIPKELLANAKKAAINFHPGPPEYPGIGCTNFALYNNEVEFGVTCHHMQAKVDTGAIIAVKRFPIFPEDTVFALTQRCYEHILHLFYEVIDFFMERSLFPASGEKWQRNPFTRKQLNELCTLTPDMTAEEIKKRLKATTFGDKIWAEVKIGPEKISYEAAIEKGIL
ncbi:MAG TPA: formyltransferase family protein [Chitinophagaceae bacterium]